jgi:hypothetical protein
MTKRFFATEQDYLEHKQEKALRKSLEEVRKKDPKWYSQFSEYLQVFQLAIETGAKRELTEEEEQEAVDALKAVRQMCREKGVPWVD